jgi:hypothetical protein
MPTTIRLILLMMLALCAGAGGAEPSAWEYPAALLDAYDANDHCWRGMDANGVFPVRVAPLQWLVGPPPSAASAVTLPMDHWVDLAFSGRLADGAGEDIVVVETGQAGEQALLFVTDGADREYLLTRLEASNSQKQELSCLGVDLAGVTLPFVPRAVRVVGLDLGGQSPGFDLSNVVARVSHQGGLQACYPNPVDGAVGVRLGAKLTWSPGSGAVRHVVYFGTAAPQVQAAADDVRYMPPPPDANAFQPPALQLGRTYYWRVDEIRDQGSGVGDQGSGTLTPDPWPPIPGEVWSFTVTDCLILDDFEAYDLDENYLYETWQTRGRADVSIGQGIAFSCDQSLLFHYNFDATWPSEVVRTFAEPQDWVRVGAGVLEFALRGTLGNAVKGQMYVVLSDGRSEQRAPYRGDLHVLADPQWHYCRIALTDFNSIDLTHVTSIALGLRCATTNLLEHGMGTIYVDDVALRSGLCVPAGTPDFTPLPGDLTGDGAVDCRDLQRLAQDWLCDSTLALAVATPNEPVLWYDFDGNAEDRTGVAHGQILGRCTFVPGVYGQAIRFAYPGDSVTVPDACRVFERLHDAITITFWQQGNDSTHRNDTLCCSNYVYGQSDPTIAIHLGCWRDPGQYRWDCGSPWSFENRLAGRHRAKEEWAGRWNHWAFTKDIRRGRMEIYLNGRLYDSLAGTNTPITGITSFEIGSGWYGRYDGALDDFRIYDYALSAAEIADVATRGTGLLPVACAGHTNSSGSEDNGVPSTPYTTADLNADGTVNFLDFATWATQGLGSGL